MSGRVVVVGDVMTDILVLPDGPIARGTDRRAKIEQQPGGSGANQAVWLAALGVEALLAARVAEADRTRLAAYFEGQGVVARLASDESKPTGTLVCLVDADGERSFLTDRGANAGLSATDLPPSLLDGAEILHISGYALFEPAAREGVTGLIEEARRRGILVSIDPASTGFLCEAGPQAFLEWTNEADIVFPNADEARLLTGEVEPEMQIARLLGTYKSVVLKRGAEGAVCAARGQEAVTARAPEVEVVDTTGAGDAFVAGYLAALLAGDEAGAALERAISAGSRAVRQLGAQPRQAWDAKAPR